MVNLTKAEKQKKVSFKWAHFFYNTCLF